MRSSIIVALAAAAAASAAAPSLTLHTPSVSGMTATADLSWEYPTDMNISDCFIGIFSPTDANVTAVKAPAWPATPPFTATAPVAYLDCTSFSGEATVELFNMRDDYIFHLFTGGVNTPRKIATSGTLKWEDAARPMHVHLMRTQDPTEMQVQWNSKDEMADARVQYGFASGQYKYEADASASTTYGRDDLCGGIANTVGYRDPGHFHTAVMTKLPADGETRVYYRVGSDSAWTAEFSFVTALKPGANSTLKFLAIADMGVSYGTNENYHWAERDAWETMKWTGQWAQKDHHLLIHIGDISYATGYAAKWDPFMHGIEQVAAYVPYMVSEGNHERDFPKSGSYYTGEDSGGECGVATSRRFPMPLDKSTTTKEFWYSFEQGPVHFIMASSEVDIIPGSKQYAWIEADLKKVDRTVTPWIIFSYHRPMYHSNVRDEYLGTVEPLLNDYQVDLGLAGHVHNAQLWCPQYESKCVTAPAGEWGAMQYAVIGNAGMDLNSFPDDLDDRTLFAMSAWGYSRLEVNATVLTMEFYANTDNTLKYTLKLERHFPRA